MLTQYRGYWEWVAGQLVLTRYPSQVAGEDSPKQGMKGSPRRAALDTQVMDVQGQNDGELNKGEREAEMLLEGSWEGLSVINKTLQ